MRQPTFNRSRARQQRLIRTGIGIVAVVAAIAAGTSLLGGGDTEEPPQPTPQVAFTANALAYADSGDIVHEDRVADETLQAEVDRITRLLETWYQNTYIEPAVFEVDTDTTAADVTSFPPEDALEVFVPNARAQAAADLDTLTLGSARTSFARVEPKRARAHVSVLFAKKGTDPKLAVVTVTWRATGILKDEVSPPVRIDQSAVYHMRFRQGAWQITYYEADQTLASIEPTSTPTENP